LYRAFYIPNILYKKDTDLYKKDTDEKINGGFKMKMGISIGDSLGKLCRFIKIPFALSFISMHHC